MVQQYQGQGFWKNYSVKFKGDLGWKSILKINLSFQDININCIDLLLKIGTLNQEFFE